MGAPYFQVEIEQGTDPLRVIANGELDAASADQLAASLAAAHETGTSIALDLGGVTFIDSSGLRVIAAEVSRSEETGETFAVSVASDAVRRIFEMTGLTALITS